MKTCVVPISLYCGVPHSSVLGSLLPHIVYSSHLAKSCHHWQNFHLYADDTLLLLRSPLTQLISLQNTSFSPDFWPLIEMFSVCAGLYLIKIGLELEFNLGFFLIRFFDSIQNC